MQYEAAKNYIDRSTNNCMPLVDVDNEQWDNAYKDLAANLESYEAAGFTQFKEILNL